MGCDMNYLEEIKKDLFDKPMSDDLLVTIGQIIFEGAKKNEMGCDMAIQDEISKLALNIGGLIEKNRLLEQQNYELQAKCDELSEALKEAAMSLQSISAQAGKGEFMDDMISVRGYARSRSAVAYEAMTKAGIQ